MNDKIDWQYLSVDTRARVFLLWAFIVLIGFIATHFFQNKLINGFWATLSVVGLYYMFRVMPLKVKQMRNIFYCWFFTIGFGMAVSGLVFYVDSKISSFLIGHLGAFWMVVMALGYFANGWVDKPAKWYYFAALLNLLFGLLCFTVDALMPGQYLIAAVISTWSMLYLWLFRSYP